MNLSVPSLDAVAHRDLRVLFNPRSIAIVGASDNPEKYGNWLAKRAIAGTRPVHLVNGRNRTLFGRQAVQNLRNIDETVDLALIAVPAQAFESAVEDALFVGARAIVGITAGLGEASSDGRRRERVLADRVRAAGACLLGPNCLGVLDHTSGLDATVNDFPIGSVALLSQSGNVAIDVAHRLASYGMGISRFASLGNQSDLDASDLIDSCIEHEGTKAIALYCEGIQDGRRFVAAARRAAEAGKPVVLLTVGRSAASARGAASHTGSLVTSDVVLSVACEAAGAEFVTSPREMADLLQGLVRTNPPSGRRVAVIADGGGHASLASDALEAAGLLVAPFDPSFQERIAAHLPEYAGTSNPVDLAGTPEKDIRVFERVVTEFNHGSNVDALVITGYFGGYGEYSVDLAAAEVRTAKNLAGSLSESATPAVAHLVYAESAAADALRAGGIAVYRDAETMAWVLDRLVTRLGWTPPDAYDSPLPMPRISHADYWSSREMLISAGIDFVPAHHITTLEQLSAAADTLQFPLVLKALGDEHKSDRGGVALGLNDQFEVEVAWKKMDAELSPPSYSIEQMADLSNSVELIVGVRRDPSFGIVVMVGLGGIFAEALNDTQCALGPIDRETALRMIGRLKGGSLLHGFRGRPPVDMHAVADCVVRLSQFATEHPEISEVECNPVAVSSTGAVALDARIVLQ